MIEVEINSKKIEILPFWEVKVNSFFSGLGIGFKVSPGKYRINPIGINQENKVLEVLNAIKEKNFWEALLTFPSLEVEDLFLEYYRVPFLDLLPYLEELDQKGIVFDFGENPSDSSWVIDANDCAKLISQEEHQNLLALENRLGSLLPRASETNLAKSWFLTIGLNYLHKVYINVTQNINDDVEHVLDFLNSFDRELIELETNRPINPVDLERILQLKKERERILKSSYEENLVKSALYFSRLAKKLSKEEDWEGIEKVYEVGDFTVYQLLSEKSKDRESAIMQHCVGNGGYDLSSGIYSLRDKNNFPLATIEIDENGKIIQIQGFTNQKLNPKALVPIKNFITNYLKLTPDEIELDTNTGWAKVTLNYPEFGYQVKQNIYFSSEALPLAVANYNYSFNIKDLHWKDELEKEFEVQHTPQAIREVVLTYLEKNPPFVLKKSLLGFNFDKALKVPNLQRITLIEELATHIHENLQYFDEASANAIRQINYDFKSVKTGKDAISLLTHLDVYFQKGLNTKRWSTLDSDKIIEELTKNPIAAFEFYKKYLQILKKLNPSAIVAFEPSFWLEVFGSIFPYNLLEQDFLKMADELKEIASSLDSKEALKVSSIEELLTFSKMLNPTQNLLLKKHIKNLKNEVKKLNQEMLLFISENTDFTSFFLEFDLHALDSYDFFILEDTVPEASREFWLLNQQVKFVLFHLTQFKKSINSPSYQNIRVTFTEIKNIFNKITTLVKLSDLSEAKFPEITPEHVLESVESEINETESILKEVEKLIDANSLVSSLAKCPSETIVLEILESWQESFKNSRVAKKA